MVELGGELTMGTPERHPYGAKDERPAHLVVLEPFRIDATAVSNAQFAEFVEATGHTTEAERCGWSFVFAGLLEEPVDGAVELGRPTSAPWWVALAGASWRAPEGPASSLEGRADHPVVHVSWSDASSFAAWAGLRLPTEAEWELAARGGLEDRCFPWGDELEPGGRHAMNVWQGDFPIRNTCDDGWYGTAPVDAYEPNGLGVWNMTGNVWEWCADWYAGDYYAASPLRNPVGPAQGTERVTRGGSYLCHASYCARYRVGARNGTEPGSTMGNLGFRCAS